MAKLLSVAMLIGVQSISLPGQSRHDSEPAVNPGDTTFLDALGGRDSWSSRLEMRRMTEESRVQPATPCRGRARLTASEASRTLHGPATDNFPEDGTEQK
jgi:hypothetical protein